MCGINGIVNFNSHNFTSIDKGVKVVYYSHAHGQVVLW
jgi:hypothetical protein